MDLDKEERKGKKRKKMKENFTVPAKKLGAQLVKTRCEHLWKKNKNRKKRRTGVLGGAIQLVDIKVVYRFQARKPVQVMERTPSLLKKEDSLQREEKGQFLSDLVKKIEKYIKASDEGHWGEASGGTTSLGVISGGD